MADNVLRRELVEVVFKIDHVPLAQLTKKIDETFKQNNITKPLQNSINDINKPIATVGAGLDNAKKRVDETFKNPGATKPLQNSIKDVNKPIATIGKALDDTKKRVDATFKDTAATKTFEKSVNKTKSPLSKLKGWLGDVGKKSREAYEKGLEMGDGFKKGADKANVGIKGLMSSLVGANLITQGINKIGNSLKSFVTGAVQSFGELEQNLGGSEAVFGQFANSIQEVGENAYRNLGVSQSDYLATANKMGALFQGSGLTQQKSLDFTTKAMQRAADMASVMGIDMEMAMESVAGAAKGNFTMMDNLGVAMNATNIEAYALQKGINFEWKAATQAQKTEMAMKMFFENTEQYAGNFARESEQTLSGSFGLLKASWASFLGGLANESADMSNLTSNLVNAFKIAAQNITPVLTKIFESLPGAFKTAWAEVKELLPPAVVTSLESLTEKVTAVWDTAKNLVSWVIDNFDKIKPVIEGVVIAMTAWKAITIAGAIATKILAIQQGISSGATIAAMIAQWGLNAAFLACPLTWIVLGIMALIAVIILMALNWDKVVAAVKKAWEAIKEWLGKAWEFIKQVISNIADWFKNLGVKIGDTFIGIWNIVAQWAANVWNTIAQWVANTRNTIVQWATNVWNTIAQWVTNTRNTIVQWATNVWNVIVSVFTTIWQAIKPPLMAIWNFISSVFNLIATIITTILKIIWTVIVGVFTNIWRFITTICTTVWNFIVNVFMRIYNAIAPPIQNAYNFIVSIFTAIWTAIVEKCTAIWNKIVEIATAIWNKIVEIATAIWNKIVEVVTAIWNKIVEIATAIWNKIVEVVTAIWNKIVEVVTAIWNKIVEVVTAIWDAIVSYFTSIWKAIVEKCTAIWRAITEKFTAIWNVVKEKCTAIWKAIVEKFNAIKTAISEKMTAVWDKIKEVWDKVTNFLKGINLFEIGANIFQGLLGGLSSKIGALTDWIKGVGEKITGGLKKFFNIASPSKVMAKLFANLPTGMVKGLESGMGAIERTMSDITSLIMTPSYTVASANNAPVYTPEATAQYMSNTSTHTETIFSPTINNNLNGNSNTADIKDATRDGIMEAFAEFSRKNPQKRVV